VIIYLLREINENSIVYAKEWGPTPGSRMRLVRYDDLMRADALEPGTYIFSNLDILSAAQLSVAKKAWQVLSSSERGIRLLNNPALALDRFNLLSTLHAEGINRFRVFRAAGLNAEVKFPVFVRYEKRHTGALTPLLYSVGGLKRALRYLRIRGHRLRDLLIVEFCDTSDSNGIFRKYGAFLVGSCVLPRHLFFSREWMTKRSELSDAVQTDQAFEAERHDYLYGNPHEQWIKDIFRHAGLDFGRVDYGMLGDTPQVWEINSNPTIKSLTPRLTKALESIDHVGMADRKIPFSVEPSLRRARRLEHCRERCQEYADELTDWLTEAPVLRPMVRLIKQLLRHQ